MTAMTPCPIETMCGDNCGTTIKKGAPSTQMRGFWAGKPQTYYICEACEKDRQQEQRNEDSCAAND